MKLRVAMKNGNARRAENTHGESVKKKKRGKKYRYRADAFTKFNKGVIIQ